MTPSANLDLLRSLFAMWERGDFSSAEWADPNIELVWADGLSPGTWTGIAEMAEGYRDWMSAWEEYSVRAEDYRELDAERVLVLTLIRGRGKASGLELGHDLRDSGAAVFHLRDGKVTRFIMYTDRDRGLADLGLAPEADSDRP